MIACVDTHYTEHSSTTALVLFENWQDDAAAEEHVDISAQEPADYVPGEFFRRELPCILAAIQPFRERIDTLIIDGYVYLDQTGRKGLGALLYEAQEESIPVIGVAKNRFHGSGGSEVYRGASDKPLIVTAVGYDTAAAAQHIQSMHGAHRIPTLLKRADSISRGG